jgi:hypothetical protein
MRLNEDDEASTPDILVAASRGGLMVLTSMSCWRRQLHVIGEDFDREARVGRVGNHDSAVQAQRCGSGSARMATVI